MTLDDAKVLLTDNNIPFDLVEYENEKEYWHHTMLFPYTKNAQVCKVLVLVVRSNNGKKDIELQFNEKDGIFCFEEIRFGSYCFEVLCEVKEEKLAEELIACIREVQEGYWRVIVANNIKRRFWLWDACFDLNDTDDDISGKKAFDEAMLLIEESEKVSGGVFGKFLDKLLRTKVQYEIYDWNTYQCIVKE